MTPDEINTTLQQALVAKLRLEGLIEPDVEPIGWMLLGYGPGPEPGTTNYFVLHPTGEPPRPHESLGLLATVRSLIEETS